MRPVLRQQFAGLLHAVDDAWRKFVLAEAETDWVFVDAATGRPRAIPGEIRKVLESLSAKPRKPASDTAD
jgi:acyl-CoA thioesterase FadM